VRSYQAVFLGYAGLGFLNVLLTCVLSSRVELPEHEDQKDSDGEEEPLLSDTDSTNDVSVAKNKRRSLLPRISKESRIVLFKLCLLFALDSLASGLVPA
jgi:hypothetical protein